MDKKKKIIIAAEIFPPDIGGPATYGKRLAEELVKRGHSVRVFTYGEQPMKFNFPVKYISRKIPFGLRQIFYTLLLLPAARKADVIYAQGPSVGPATIIAKKLFKKRVIVKYVGDQSWQQIRMKGETVPFEEYMKSFGKKHWDSKTTWIQKWQRYSLKHADKVITPSKYLKSVLHKYLDVPEEKIKVISNAATFNMGAIERTPQHSAIYFGRIENWKGLETLIEAIAEMPEYKLFIVGDGSKKTDYENLAKKKGASDRIVFTGRVAHDELLDYFKQSYCYILGSEYEGMAFSILEAWSYGLPVIVSDFPANTELVKHEETGLVYKTGDKDELKTAISRFWLSQGLREQISDKALKEVAKYTTENMVGETLKILINKK